MLVCERLFLTFARVQYDGRTAALYHTSPYCKAALRRVAPTPRIVDLFSIVNMAQVEHSAAFRYQEDAPLMSFGALVGMGLLYLVIKFGGEAYMKDRKASTAIWLDA